jgi:diguanylate cyclase (GGDEF)-like protein
MHAKTWKLFRTLSAGILASPALTFPLEVPFPRKLRQLGIKTRKNMQTPALPKTEFERIATLRSLNILDTLPEERFDQLTRIAKRVFDVPIAQVSLIDSDRQWIKSSAGYPPAESPREISFCAHAILGDDVMHVEDARADQRFHDNPLVLGDPNIRFYAGCPLRVNDQNLGTLCLIGREPRTFTADEEQILRDLARMAEQNLAAEQLAVTDNLTQLTNRRGFESFAGHILAVCNRLGRAATLLFFDLNSFKPINDNFGHAEGDRALRTFANCLITEFRESDAVARLGGDEFAVLLTGVALPEAQQATERLRARVDRVNQTENRGYNIRFSVGRIQYDPTRHASIDNLLAEADAAMYDEKNREGNAR